MNPSHPRRAGALFALVAVLLLASCGLPQVGPNKRQIYAGSVQRQGDAFVIAINDRVTRATAITPALGFSEAFKNAGRLTSDVIRPGDTLGLTVWENVDDGLLAGAGTNATILEQVQVDGAGFIFVPYAGRVRAAGNTPDALRRVITGRLADQTPDPQVQVRRLAGDGATVTLVGTLGGQGVYPIERPTRTLASMLANAGGIVSDPDISQVTVIRGPHVGKIWFQDLFKYPAMDIALRGGDRILVEEDSRSFTAIGATATQSRVPFTTQTLSAIEALAQVGGLLTAASDPTGIFIMRNEAEEVVERMLGRNDLTGAQRVVYVLDLTRPNGIFLGRDFVIRDGDTLYVTEAPFVQWNKSIAALTGSLGTAASVATILGANNN